MVGIDTGAVTGVYSIAEAVDDSNKRPKKTVFCVSCKDEDDHFSASQYKSIHQTKTMILRNGGFAQCVPLISLSDAIEDLSLLLKDIKDEVYETT